MCSTGDACVIFWAFRGKIMLATRTCYKEREWTIYTIQLTKDEDDSLVTSYVFHHQDQSVQQYSGPQKVGRGKEADPRRHDRTC